MENQINLEMLDELESEFERNGSGFEIDSDDKAEWALQKIEENQKEFDRLSKLAENQIEQIKLKLEKAKTQNENSRCFFTEKLKTYFNNVEHKKTKTQESYKLLSGTLVMKKGKDKIEKDDDELLIFIKQNNLNDFIKTKESVSWSDFKKGLFIKTKEVEDAETGEVVEVKCVVDADGNEVNGCTVVHTEDVFDVK